MKRLEIYIDNQLVDIEDPKDVRFIILRDLLNYEEVTTRSADKTYTISIPRTKRNELIFGAKLNDVQTVNKYNTFNELSIRAVVDGTQTFDGKASLIDNGPKGPFSLTCRSNQITWADQLRSRSLRDIESFNLVPFIGAASQFPATEPVGAVTQPDIQLLNADSTDVQFPLVSYGNYYRASSANSGEDAWDMANVDWQDIPPSFYVVNVLKALFADAGFSISGKWINDEEIKKKLLPYIAERDPVWNWGFLAKAAAKETSVYSYFHSLLSNNADEIIYPGVYWNLIASVEDYDYSNSLYQTSPKQQYITPVQGEYTFVLDLNVVHVLKDMSGTASPIPPVSDYTRTALAIVIIPDDSTELADLKTDLFDYIGDNTVSVVSDPFIIAFWDFGNSYTESPHSGGTVSTTSTLTLTSTGTPGTPGAKIEGTGDLTMSIANVPLNRGDRVEFLLINQAGDSAPLVGTNIDVDEYFLQVYEGSHSTQLQIAPNLPDVNQLDFFSALIQMYNLYFTVDAAAGVLNITTWEDFYQSPKFAIDLSGVIDINNGIHSPVPYYRKTKWSYANDDSDFFLKKYGIDFASHEEEVINRYAIQKDEPIEISLFAPTVERRYRVPKLLLGQTSYLIIPTIADADSINTEQQNTQWKFNYVPRILTYVGLLSGTWQYNGSTETEYPAARFSYSEGSENSLCFSENAGRVLDRGNTLVVNHSPGLYGLYWEKFQLMRPKAHIINVEGQISESQFAQMVPEKLISIDGLHYVQYRFTNGFDPLSNSQTQLELLRWTT